ncbi:MAG: putative Ig domain-containing protein, partial [Bacteroidota bacterium]|nr:putative Ig domain-containing protein [Bacteroidota bacterium]
MTASDGTASATDEFTLTVVNTNDAPTLSTPIADASIDEDAGYSLDASGAFTDVDAGDTLTYSMSGAPASLSIDASTGAISGSPTNDEVGVHTITVTLTDLAGESASDSYDLTVVNTNDAPTVSTPIADVSADEDAGYSLDASSAFSDVDVGDTLSYSMSGAPSSFSIDSATGIISGTPTNDEVGTYTITVTATDVAATSASDSYVLTVANTNDAPTISSTAIVTGTEDVLYSYTVTVADIDPSGTMTLCDITNSGASADCTVTLPAGEVLDLAFGDSSYYTSEFSMTVLTPGGTTDTYAHGDGPVSYSTAGDYTITLIDSYGDGGGYVTASYEFGDSYTLAGTTIPAWMSFDTSTGVLSGTPDDSGVWDNSIVITATDESGATAVDSFTLNITNVNDAPQGSSALVGDGSPWTTSSTLTEVGSGSASSGTTFTLSSTQRATITMTNTDYYAYECGLQINGVAYSCGYSGNYGYLTGTPVSLTAAGSYTVIVTDSYGDGGNYATIVIEDGTVATTYVLISGSLYDGEALTADMSLLSDDDGLGTFNYQWANQDGDIAGATSSSYTIPACDDPTVVCGSLGDTFSVTVSYTDGFETLESVSSGTTSAAEFNPNGDLDGDTIINSLDTDDDGDGWIDSVDAFPLLSTEWVDTDGDTIGNNADLDDDNDGVADTDDDFPLDSTEQWDADGDGGGHTADNDDDGDGIEDANDDDRDGDGDPNDTDQFPDNYNEWDDTDSDGIGNNADTDDDGDGYDDTVDAFPLDSTEWLDTDSDGTGNNADTDDDGDGYSDADETTNCVSSIQAATDTLDATSFPLDTDGDMSCDTLDSDDDGEGYDDTADVFPLDSTEWADYDGDGTGDNADTDDDNDGSLDVDDPFPFDVDAWIDTDGDGLADDFPYLSETTLDGDGSPWTETSSLTATVSGSLGTEVSFTITSIQRAVITFSFDNYPGECGVILDGTSTSCTDTTLTTAGTHTVQMTDSWGDGGSSAT